MATLAQLIASSPDITDIAPWDAPDGAFPLTLAQLAMFPDAEILPRAEESLEQLLEQYDVVEDHEFITLIRKYPAPFSAAWYAEHQQ